MTVSFNDLYATTTTFQNYEQLNFVCLWMAKIDARGLQALAIFFTIHPTVSTLHLIDCGITSEMSCSLATICKEAKSLKNFVVDHNPIGSKGASQIFNGIRDHSSIISGLQNLSLKYCECDIDCAESLALMLSNNIFLTTLDLTGNYLEDESLFLIAETLKQNKTLTTLSLAANGILVHENIGLMPPNEQNAATPLSNGLGMKMSSKGRPSISAGDIKKIKIFDSAVTFPGVQCLSQSLSTFNTTLRVLDLSGNHFGNQAGEEVLKMLQARKSKSSPLVCHVTERLTVDLFEKIWELNNSMTSLSGKKSGKKSSKGGKKKK
ncbi:NACHT, LRR and PYD domains-containing protein 14 [Clydaea vesicula]|uniref:NACHT, LRR and PYD domains-containing protein 14 n=1 Tax=Clydaea vesicula TaxID=447962 RepID=A0AAD5TV88_9FUNG|nr:NACHT, LRR and PYD domains-containing protein 14 [Clydaea vesicula]